MNKHEAAKLVGKSVKTIERWERDGVRVYDEVCLREHSAMQDARSKGKTRLRIAERIDAGVFNQSVKDTSASLEYCFPQGLDPDAFVDLPAPFRQSDAASVLDSLEAIKSAFERRLSDLQVIGHKGSIELAAEELERIEAILSLFLALVNGYDGA